MAYVFVVSDKKASADGAAVTTDGADTSSADFIAVFVVDYEPSTEGTLSDSNGNTPTKKTVYSNAGANRGVWYFYDHPIVGPGHTFSRSSVASSFPTLFMLAFSGSAASPHDQENSDIGVLEETFCGDVTPAEDNELLLAGLALYNTVTNVAVDSGFTGLETILTSSTNIPGGVSYKILGTGTLGIGVNPKYTWTTASNAIGIMETFKAAVVGGVSTWNRSSARIIRTPPKLSVA